MSEQELTKAILDFIKETYKAEYIGLLEVKKLNPGFTFTIGLPSYMSPTTMNIDTESDQEFLDYIYSELKSRNYMRLDIYKVNRTKSSREE